MGSPAGIAEPMSVDDFLVWAGDRPGRWQLVDGAPCAMAPAGVLHGVLQAEMGGLLRNHLRQTGSRCRVVTAPGVVPRMFAEVNMRVPDLAVTCGSFGRDARAMVDPVLIVEILSPTNQGATWSNVRAYTSIPAVREILVLRWDRVGASLLRRAADGLGRSVRMSLVMAKCCWTVSG